MLDLLVRDLRPPALNVIHMYNILCDVYVQYNYYSIQLLQYIQLFNDCVWLGMAWY